MQSANELMELAQLVRGTAAALIPALARRLEADAAETLDPQVLSEARAEFGVAFQSLVRVARRLDLIV